MLNLRRFYIILMSCGLMIAAGGQSVRAELQLSQWQTYAGLAEQGAICASFSALMESQSVLNKDIGRLWQERRKFAGAVIRSAAEMELGRSPGSDEINLLVSSYSEWVLGALLQEDASFGDFDTLSEDSASAPIVGPEQMQKLINEHCTTLFAQGDEQILSLNPELAYLLGSAQPSSLLEMSQNQNMAVMQDGQDTGTPTSEGAAASEAEKTTEQPEPVKTAPVSTASAEKQSGKSLKDKLAAIVKTAGARKQSAEPAARIPETDPQAPSAPAQADMASEADTSPTEVAQSETSDKQAPLPEDNSQLSEAKTETALAQNPAPVELKTVRPQPMQAAPETRTLPEPTRRPAQKPEKTVIVTSASAPPSEPEEKTPSPQPQSPTTAASTVILATPKMRASPSSASAAEPAGSGRYVAQLGSFSRQRNAETAKSKIEAEFAALFNLIPLEVNEHMLTSGRRFFRLETSAIDKKKAHYICDQLWQVRLACLLKQAPL